MPRYRQINGELVEIKKGVSKPGVEIMPDIQPYQSMIDGSIISSRSQHRRHLKDHNCIEIGNEVKHLVDRKPNPQLDRSRHEMIRENINNMSHKEFKAMIRQTIKQIRGY